MLRGDDAVAAGRSAAPGDAGGRARESGVRPRPDRVLPGPGRPGGHPGPARARADLLHAPAGRGDRPAERPGRLELARGDPAQPGGGALPASPDALTTRAPGPARP